jgi:hypothetical protein
MKRVCYKFLQIFSETFFNSLNTEWDSGINFQIFLWLAVIEITIVCLDLLKIPNIPLSLCALACIITVI